MPASNARASVRAGSRGGESNPSCQQAKVWSDPGPSNTSAIFCLTFFFFYKYLVTVIQQIFPCCCCSIDAVLKSLQMIWCYFTVLLQVSEAVKQWTRVCFGFLKTLKMKTFHSRCSFFQFYMIARKICVFSLRGAEYLGETPESHGRLKNPPQAYQQSVSSEKLASQAHLKITQDANLTFLAETQSLNYTVNDKYVRQLFQTDHFQAFSYHNNNMTVRIDECLEIFTNHRT